MRVIPYYCERCGHDVTASVRARRWPREDDYLELWHEYAALVERERHWRHSWHLAFLELSALRRELEEARMGAPF